MLKIAIILMGLITYSWASANEILPTNARTVRQQSEKKLREVLAQIPTDFNSCRAKVDVAFPNEVQSIHCDGELVVKGLQIVPSKTFQSVSNDQASSLFITVMLDVGFDLKSLSSYQSADTYVFQRSRPSDKVDTNGF